MVDEVAEAVTATRTWIRTARVRDLDHARGASVPATGAPTVRAAGATAKAGVPQRGEEMAVLDVVVVEVVAVAGAGGEVRATRATNEAEAEAGAGEDKGMVAHEARWWWKRQEDGRVALATVHCRDGSSGGVHKCKKSPTIDDEYRSIPKIFSFRGTVK